MLQITGLIYQEAFGGYMHSLVPVCSSRLTSVSRFRSVARPRSASDWTRSPWPRRCLFRRRSPTWWTHLSWRSGACASGASGPGGDPGPCGLCASHSFASAISSVIGSGFSCSSCFAASPFGGTRANGRPIATTSAT